MKILIFLVLVGIHSSAAVTHSMTYIVTAVSGLDGFPEHNEVGLVNGQEFVHYDSNLKKIIPKTVWIEKNEGADYWERETQRNINTQEVFKGYIATAMKRFNQTGGVHIVQWMYGCGWDDDSKEVKGFWQYGYDGEDFISFDLKTQTWTAPVPQAVVTKHKWDNDKALIAQAEQYLTEVCPDWVKKYVNYGRSSLMRTDLPTVSLLQKSPSSPVSCHATGFYPERALMLWRKDGEDLHEDVDQGETLPNHDGSFQMSVDLDLSSVKPEDWGRYKCVFQLSGVNEDIVIKLDKAVIKTNETSTTLIPIIIAAVVILVAIIGGVGFFLYRQKSAKRPPSSVNNREEVKKPLNA